MTRKPIILTSVATYLPGHKAGGPVRTIANIVEALGDEIEFRIVTADRDLGDQIPYPDIPLNTWTPVGKASVWYVSADQSFVKTWSRLLKETPHDVLYLNSLFEPRFTLSAMIAAKLKGASTAPIVLAPRGELSPGALALKRRKKAVFLGLAKLLGLYRGLVWHASTEEEAVFIREQFGAGSKLVIARDLATIFDDAATRSGEMQRSPDKLNAVFLSRISRKKNLDYALRVIAKSTVPLRFDIWGPIEDSGYWEECEALMRALPAHVEARYCGVADHADVGRTLARYDLFFLPTLGENFGHVVAESISVGTPVLLADTTPWRGLAQEGVGWDLPLDEHGNGFVDALQQAWSRVVADRDGWRESVREYAKKELLDPALVEANRRVFFLEPS
jgi:glycosyltransferase involved in cell wall biosynthesis